MKEENIAKTKKWIIVLSVLVLIAIVVTLIIVFLPKDKNALLVQTQNQCETMFLQDQKESQRFEELKNNVSRFDEYSSDANNVYKLAGDLNQILEFYVFPLTYANADGTFQGNYSLILRSYEEARAKQNEIDKILQAQFGDEDDSFIKGAWQALREQFAQYLKATASAISGLNNIFKNSIPKGMIVNDYSCLITDNIDNYLQSINRDFIELEQAKDLSKKVEYFSAFVELIYYPKAENIYSYFNSKTLQQQVATINDFTQLYKTDFVNLIDSIKSSGFTFTASEGVVDTHSVLETTKTFLKGELAA